MKRDTTTQLQKRLTSGALAKAASVNVQTIRYYERIGLLEAPARQSSGYRMFDTNAVNRLLFIKRAQDLGFTLDEVRELLALRISSAQSRSKVRGKARQKIQAIQGKIESLQKLQATLEELLHECERESKSGPCPILEKLEGHL
jgi:Hg(II)-responsive transcriptional regulator